MGVAVLIGLGAGLVGAFGAMRLVGGLLWGMAAADPMSLAVGVGVLVAAIALAAAVPLRQAVRADPAAALRAE
jgi:ABC-type antimicrobial peptide transport system permease subunit